MAVVYHPQGLKVIFFLGALNLMTIMFLGHTVTTHDSDESCLIFWCAGISSHYLTSSTSWWLVEQFGLVIICTNCIFHMFNLDFGHNDSIMTALSFYRFSFASSRQEKP